MTPEKQAAHEAAEAAKKAAEMAALKPEDAAKQIAALNLENAQRRHKEKLLEDKLAEIDPANKAAAEKAAAEKGEFKTLYEGLKGEHEGATAKLTAMEAALGKILDAEIANIPENFRSLIPAGDASSKLEWIATAKAAKLFESKARAGGTRPR